ncbi:MAG: rane protein, partial [Gammaproteobacteria bacterium]|nr:rane protein [Gammaproteobacteria bacterium]
MAIFSYLYDKMLNWSRHRHAPYYLGGISFAESSFFPLAPDIMLAPMALANPQRAWLYAGITTLASTLGGIFGYIIGAYLFTWLHPYLIDYGYEPVFLKVMGWFKDWGFWAVFLAGFSPIPYKLFTIGGGALGIPLLPFIIASIIGRGSRFFIVAALMYWGGNKMEQRLREI